MFIVRYKEGFEVIRGLVNTSSIQEKCKESYTKGSNYSAALNESVLEIENFLDSERKDSAEFLKTVVDQLKNLKLQFGAYQQATNHSLGLAMDQLKMSEKITTETINQRQKVEQIYLDVDAKLKADAKNSQMALLNIQSDLNDIIKQKGIVPSHSFAVAYFFSYFSRPLSGFPCSFISFHTVSVYSKLSFISFCFFSIFFPFFFVQIYCET